MAVKNISGQPAPQSPSVRVSDAGTSKVSKSTDAVSATALAKSSIGGAGAKGVDVAVSDKAKGRAAEQKLAKEIAMNSPEIREDKVAAIKSRLDAGTYQIDSQKIEDGMMREAIMEHLAKGE